jgi:hypothetical protein
MKAVASVFFRALLLGVGVIATLISVNLILDTGWEESVMMPATFGSLGIALMVTGLHLLTPPKVF